MSDALAAAMRQLNKENALIFGGSEKASDKGKDPSASGLKYELTENTMEVDGKTLYQIRAVDNFKMTVNGKDIAIKAGDLGGYVEKGSKNDPNNSPNLSQDGSSWIGQGACVYGKGRVEEDAYVGGNSKVSGGTVKGNAVIGVDTAANDFRNIMFQKNPIHSPVIEGGVIEGNAVVLNNVHITGGHMTNNARAEGFAEINASGKDEPFMGGHSKIKDHAELSGNARLDQYAIAGGDAKVEGDAKVSGHWSVGGHAVIDGDAVLKEDPKDKDGKLLGDCHLSTGVFNDRTGALQAAALSDKGISAAKRANRVAGLAAENIARAPGRAALDIIAPDRGMDI